MENGGMSEFKIAGACTTCDEPCFEVLQVWDENGKYPGEPRRLGPPLPGSMRVSFMLMDGSRADLTFCGKCAGDLDATHYTGIWRKVIRSWIRESQGKCGEQAWFRAEFFNGLLAEMGRISWSEFNG